MHTEHVWNTATCVLTLDVAVYGDKRGFGLRLIARSRFGLQWISLRFGKELVRVIVAKSRVKWQMRAKSFDIWQSNVCTVHRDEKIILKINFREFYS